MRLPHTSVSCRRVYLLCTYANASVSARSTSGSSVPFSARRWTAAPSAPMQSSWMTADPLPSQIGTAAELHISAFAQKESRPNCAVWDSRCRAQLVFMTASITP